MPEQVWDDERIVHQTGPPRLPARWFAMADADPLPRTPSARSWRPRRVLVTRSALEWAHGRGIAERAAAAGLDVVELPNDRLALA